MKALLFTLLAAANCSLHLCAAPSDYNAAAGFGTFMTSVSNPVFEPTIQSVTLHSETTEPDGRKRIQFHYTLANTQSGYYETPSVAVRFDPAPPWTLVATECTPASLPDLVPAVGSTASTSTSMVPLTLICLVAESTALKTAFLNGDHVVISTRELYQFSIPIKVIDAATDDSITDIGVLPAVPLLIPYTVVTTTYSVSTPLLTSLAPNTILIKASNVHNGTSQLSDFLIDMATIHDSPPPGSDLERQRENGSIEIELLVIDSTSAGQFSGKMKPMGSYLVHGSSFASQMNTYVNPQRDPTNPPLGNSFFSNDEVQARNDRIYGKEQPSIPESAPRGGNLAELRGLFNVHVPSIKFLLLLGSRWMGNSCSVGSMFALAWSRASAPSRE
jgi:hypothetical protein